jgi:MFS family permease
MGIAAAPLVTGVLTWLFSWQAAFVILGASTLAVTCLLALVRVDESHHPVHSKKPSGDGDHVKYFVIICVALVMGGLSYRGNTVLLPAYLEMNTTFFRDILDSLAFVKTQGTATLAAAVLTSFVFLMGIFGQLLGGKVADRYDLRYAYLGVQAAAVPFLLAMAFTTNYLLAFCAGMYVVFALGMQPIENSLIAALTPARWRSTGFAIKFVLVFGVGATVVYWIGLVKTRYSVEAIYVFLAGIAFLLVLSIIALIVASRRVRYIRN